MYLKYTKSYVQKKRTKITTFLLNSISRFVMRACFVYTTHKYNVLLNIKLALYAQYMLAYLYRYILYTLNSNAPTHAHNKFVFIFNVYKSINGFL